jgi:hypothetical protein
LFQHGGPVVLHDGAVHYDLDGREFFCNPVAHLHNGILRAYIRLHGYAPSAGGTHILRQLLRGIPVAVVMRRHIRAAIRQGSNHHPAELPCGPGDNGGFAG